MDTRYPKFFEEFLRLQGTLAQPKTVAQPVVAEVRRPPGSGRRAPPEPLSFDYIVAKKPKPKRVLKYLQGMIDEIVAENDA
jgi:hypothetical protein